MSRSRAATRENTLDVKICRRHKASPFVFHWTVRRGAEPGFGRGSGRRLGSAETYIQPHLTVGDMAAGQAAVPHRREEPACYPAHRDREKTRPLPDRVGRQIQDLSRATRSLRHASGDTFSSRRDGRDGTRNGARDGVDAVSSLKKSEVSLGELTAKFGLDKSVTSRRLKDATAGVTL